MRKESQGKQIPWESTSLEGDFMFVPIPPKANGTSQTVAASIPKIDRIDTPQLKPGDSWKWRTVDLLNGSVTGEQTLTLGEVTSNELRFGSLVTDMSLNALRVTDGTRIVR